MAKAMELPGARRATALPDRLVLVELVKYGLGSALALAVDWTLLIVLTELVGLHYLASATLSFSCGMIVAYALSISVVFKHRSMSDRSAELLTFVAVGLAGLILNQALMWSIVTYTPLGYLAAKVPTMGVVFLFNFTARRALLFSPRRPRSAETRRSRP